MHWIYNGKGTQGGEKERESYPCPLPWEEVYPWMEKAWVRWWSWRDISIAASKTVDPWSQSQGLVCCPCCFERGLCGETLAWPAGIECSWRNFRLTANELCWGIWKSLYLGGDTRAELWSMNRSLPDEVGKNPFQAGVHGPRCAGLKSQGRFWGWELVQCVWRMGRMWEDWKASKIGGGMTTSWMPQGASIRESRETTKWAFGLRKLIKQPQGGRWKAAQGTGTSEYYSSIS